MTLYKIGYSNHEYFYGEAIETPLNNISSYRLHGVRFLKSEGKWKVVWCNYPSNVGFVVSKFIKNPKQVSRNVKRYIESNQWLLDVNCKVWKEI